MISFESEQIYGKDYQNYELQEGEQLDTVGVGMLTYNTIEGFVPFLRKVQDLKTLLCYDVTGLVPLMEHVDQLSNDRKLFEFLKSYCQMMRNAESYLLNRENILLDQAYLDPKNGTIRVILLPVSEKTCEMSESDFLTGLLGKVSMQYSGNRKVLLGVEKLFNTEGEAYSLTLLEQTLSNLETEGALREDQRASGMQQGMRGPAGQASQAYPYGAGMGAGMQAPPIPGAVPGGNWNSAHQQMAGFSGPSMAGSVPGAMTGKKPAPAAGKKEAEHHGLFGRKKPEPAGNTADPKVQKRLEKEMMKAEKQKLKEKQKIEKEQAKERKSGKKGKSAAPVDNPFAKAPQTPKTSVMKQQMPQQAMPQKPVFQTPPVQNPAPQKPAFSNFSNPGSAPQSQTPYWQNQQQLDDTTGGAGLMSGYDNGYNNGYHEGGGYTYVFNSKPQQGTTAPTPAPTPAPVQSGVSSMPSSSGSGYSDDSVTVVGGVTGRQLLHVRTNQVYPITHDDFHIGRMAPDNSYVDVRIDNPQRFMGHDHARIMLEGDAAYLEDNNSSNHTWLNGEQLKPHVKYPLHPDDRIKMADEEFIYQEV